MANVRHITRAENLSLQWGFHAVDSKGDEGHAALD